MTQVSKLWPDWNAFIETGKKYTAKTGKALLDSVTTAASAIIFQVGGDLFYDKDDNLYTAVDASKREPVAAQSPREDRVGHRAHDGRRQHHRQGADLVAGVVGWLQEGTFAATFCPSWMLGIVADNSGPRTRASGTSPPVPGGGGNWGGSWLAVPTQSKYPKEAAKLAEYLTNAKSQVAAFKLKGPLPTNLEALKNPDFPGYTNEYFNNAPTGKIFGESVAKIKPLHLGPKHQAVKESAFEPALQLVRERAGPQAKAWEQFLKDAKTQGAF